MKKSTNAITKLTSGEKGKSLIISTSKFQGNTQMALDLHFLDHTIAKPEIIFTLRFYYWDGDWLSIGYHQKFIPPHWENLRDDGIIKIVRRPSGGGAVLHSSGITYSLTFKKPSYKLFGYGMVNNWLIKSFKNLGLPLRNGYLKKSTIHENCFATNYISDLVDNDGYKRIGSAQYRKKGAFLQHGEILINPSRELWLKLFKEEAPPKINLNLTNEEIIQHLKNSFFIENPLLEWEDIWLNDDELKCFI